MTDDVKPRRAYRSVRRAEQMAQTRRDIVTAAGAQFRAHGYGGVSMPALAAEAGVSVETIYRAFGSKAGLFRAVIDAAVAGGAARAQTPVTERPAIQAITAEPDPRRQVERYAATQPGIHRRAGPLLRVLAEAAPSDPALRALWETIETDRRHGQAGFVRMLADRSVIRADVDVDTAADGLWAVTSLAVFDLLTGLRAWSDEQYERWLADALIGLLLDPAAEPRGERSTPDARVPAEPRRVDLGGARGVGGEREGDIADGGRGGHGEHRTESGEGPRRRLTRGARKDRPR